MLGCVRSQTKAEWILTIVFVHGRKRTPTGCVELVLPRQIRLCSVSPVKTPLSFEGDI